MYAPLTLLCVAAEEGVDYGMLLYNLREDLPECLTDDVTDVNTMLPLSVASLAVPGLEEMKGVGDGLSLLQLAVVLGATRTLAFLLENDANVNLRHDGVNALDFAVQAGQDQMAQTLIEAGAECSAYTGKVAIEAEQEWTLQCLLANFPAICD